MLDVVSFKTVCPQDTSFTVPANYSPIFKRKDDMKKLIALFSAVFFVFTLTGINAWAADPEPDTSVIDRHAVWTKIIEDHKKNDSGSSEDQSAQTSDENKLKMEVRTEDRPWQKIG